VREVVTEFFQVFRAQDFSFALFRSPRHAGHRTAFAFISPCPPFTGQRVQPMFSDLCPAESCGLPQIAHKNYQS
jgi:hypothetical protein